MRMTIGDFLIRRLKEVGITEIIGVPGDFNLNWLEQIEAADGIRFVGATNELNAAYAADGYSRSRGVSCLLTTYGLGELSALNGLAGAACEHIPMISIAGSPPLFATEKRWLLHHTLADGNFGNMLESVRPFAAVADRITPMNAVDEIDSAIRAALREKRPVHLQLPSDISHLEITVPDAPLDTSLEPSDPAQLDAVLDALLEEFSAAKNPVLLVDQDAQRHGFLTLFEQLVDKTHLPYALMSSGKALLSEQHPLFLGVYNGAASWPGVQEAVEGADLLFTCTPRFIEVNSGSFSQSISEEHTIDLGDQHVNIHGTHYVGLDTTQVLREFIDRVPTATGEMPAPADNVPEADPFEPHAEAELTHARLWPQLKEFLREGDTIITEAGTSNIGLSAQRMPANVTYINSAIWGSIGYTLPALMGSQMAAPEKRHLLFIGDGSFQLTVQELSTILREQQTPIVFLLNNAGYTIERYILGMDRQYNDIANWKYSELPAVFAANPSMDSYSVRTEGELAEALAAIERSDKSDRGAFVELHLDPKDAPAGLKAFGPMTAEFDYGPRGPRNP
ncbi:pyruvate decarboxylase [Corynebacterium falsenii DSM 44353]|uniref:alpha-keto acid decarboxylase family protein n=1 Tax=Corynebacterium falsenii TaxID=108486 RepID=UPI0003E92BE5|nr:thiamine pyrophosphate-binding protein [Corynebacterium falsenii]AHI03681.1 pyruvate decarboxylase [Corynebacterium falsenii DSM 44353]UBI04405.1 alpha-keto acid decarboxylase family protein [Corynebacterium falsenii]